TIRRLLRQRVAEFPHIGVGAGRRKEGGVLEGRQLFSDRRRRQIAGADEYREGTRLTDRRSALEDPSSSGGELVHPRRHDVTNAFRNDEGRHWRLHSERAPSSGHQTGIDQRPDTFLEVKGVTSCL